MRLSIDVHKKQVQSFNDLDVFKKAYTVSLEVHKASLGFSKIEQYALDDRIRRASRSICANIAEGFAKQRESRAEFKRFPMLAIGSAEEMQRWTQYCKDLGYIEARQSDEWSRSYVEITQMLRGLRQSQR